MCAFLSPSRWFFVTSVCLLAAAGCGKSDSQSIVASKPTEQAMAGGKQLTAAGISLTFPTDWTTLDLTKGQFDRAAEAIPAGGGGADMTRMAKAAAQSGMYKMFVFDPKGSKPGFVNNANLVVTKGGAGMSLDQVMAATQKQLATMDPNLTASKVTLPAGEFGRLEAHIKGANGAPCAAFSYMQINGNELNVVTFTCAADQADTYGPKSQEIMKTFKRV